MRFRNLKKKIRPAIERQKCSIPLQRLMLFRNNIINAQQRRGNIFGF
jgi:hypothetical protein